MIRRYAVETIRKGEQDGASDWVIGELEEAEEIIECGGVMGDVSG